MAAPLLGPLWKLALLELPFPLPLPALTHPAPHPFQSLVQWLGHCQWVTQKSQMLVKAFLCPVCCWLLVVEW
eukprot:12163823-Karenia_brevis.AAC.1